MNRAIIFSAVVVALPLFATSCSSFQQTRDYYRRKHTYQASLSRITYPTTRAQLYAALPPVSPVRTSFISGGPFTASEGYTLDSDFGISMSVFYVHWPFASHPTRGVRGDRSSLITPADIDALLFRSLTIRRSPKDTISSASLTK